MVFKKKKETVSEEDTDSKIRDVKKRIKEREEELRRLKDEYDSDEDDDSEYGDDNDDDDDSESEDEEDYFPKKEKVTEKKKVKIIVVRELPTQEIREMKDEKGDLIRFVTLEEAMTEILNK